MQEVKAIQQRNLGNRMERQAMSGVMHLASCQLYRPPWGDHVGWAPLPLV
jgi:hypothetical protein